MQPVIEMRKVTKAYRGVPAVKEVDFTLHKGEVHALLDENGAGKSTLTKIMAGVVEATSGEMLHNGHKVAFTNPHEALQNGIAMIHQELNLMAPMTIAENIWIGREPTNGLGLIRHGEMSRMTRELFSQIGRAHV